jgi:hypothetical protein
MITSDGRRCGRAGTNAWPRCRSRAATGCTRRWNSSCVALTFEVTRLLSGKAEIAAVNDLRTWFLSSFVSLGSELSLSGVREAGWRPVAVFASATVVNIVVALGLATVLFGNFQVG